MVLSHPTHHDVLHVCLNMRARDAEEIYALRFEDNPFLIMNEVMVQRHFAWVAWHDGRPTTVFGAAQKHPGVFQMFAFGTDDFNNIAKPLTRFLKKTVVPTLFGELGAHRLEADSHEKHTQAHRWLRWFGARQEGVKRRYGRDGSDYYTFALLSAPKVDKADKPC